MGAASLSSRAIIGIFYRKLADVTGASWTGKVAMGPFESDQDSETYNWIGMVPQLREWVGGRQAKGFLENGITIINKAWESTLQILVKDLRRDKTKQLEVRIGEQAKRANTHWAKLLSTLILNGASSLCYDGQYFFDTDHEEGESGAQSNKLAIDISELPATVHGSVTAPSPEEMSQCILQAVQAILGFLDDQGEPMNEDANTFVVMVPITLMNVAISAVKNAVLTNGTINTIATSDFNIEVVANARLTSWTDTFAVFRTDSETKALIMQEETPLSVAAKAEGSEFEFDNAAHQYGLSADRNVGYGFWQDACQVVMG